MSLENERAWQYHQAADELLHSRIEALLIAQAFLIVGYAQILTSQDFCNRRDLQIALLAVVVLATVLTILMLFVVRGLSRGIRHLKSAYLDHPEKGDAVYRAYIAKVRGDRRNVPAWFPRIWSGWIGGVFLVFWIITGAHAYTFAFDLTKCVVIPK